MPFHLVRALSIAHWGILVVLVSVLFCAGCTLRDPAEIAELQFWAFAHGDTDRYMDYFSEQGEAELSVRMRNATAGGAGPGAFKLPFGLALVPEEAISFRVVEQSRDGIYAIIDVEILYPEPRALLNAATDTVRDWGFGRMISEMQPDEGERLQRRWEADLKERMLERFRSDPAAFRRSLRGRYVMSPTLRGWRVDVEPITAGPEET